MLPSTPLTKFGESSVERSRTRFMASLTATASGTSSTYRTSKTPMRSALRSTAGIRSSDQPWAYVATSSSIRAWCSEMPRISRTVYSFTGGSAATTRSSRVWPSGRPRTSHSKSTSRARLRALERAAIRARRSRGDATQVGGVAGVDLDLLAGRDEQRHVDLVAGLEPRGLGAAGGAVALQAGLGVLDEQLDRRRQLDVEHPALVGRDDRVLVLEQEVLGVPDDLRADLELVVGRGVHEDVGRAVVVEVLHRPLVDVRDVHLHVGVERLVDGLAGLDVLQLRADDRTTLAGLVVLEPDDGPQLPVEVENHAVLQVVGRCHAREVPCLWSVVCACQSAAPRAGRSSGSV